jgi:putative DNA primase/helicase
MKSNIDADVLRENMRGQWRGHLNSMGVELPPTPNKHGPCPYCGGKDRFRFDDKNESGSYICSQCGAGDGFGLLMKCFHWTFPQALEAVAGYLGAGAIVPLEEPRKQPPRLTPTPKVNNQQRVDKVLAQSTCSGLSLERYLASRGLHDATDKKTDCLRFHPRLPYWQELTEGRWQKIAEHPAMLGLVTDVDGKLITLHRTFLTNDGSKASVPHPKKLMAPAVAGSLRGCSIKLATPTNELCLTEGIETALAVWLDTSLPTWACVSANLLEKVNIPSHVNRVYIMADKDRSNTGEQSARKLAQRLLKKRRNITVKVCLPAIEISEDKKSTDWLDVYNSKI